MGGTLREFLRLEAVGCESWVLSGNKDLTKILQMKKSRLVVLKMPMKICVGCSIISFKRVRYLSTIRVDDGSETSLDAQLIIDFMTQIFIALSVYVANGHYRNFHVTTSNVYQAIKL